MNASAREKIFKSWSGISEVALIKEVATKGEHIQLCMEYWGRKRKMPLHEYELFFHDVVQAYVVRLLTERLVCKAENVLHNVQRDVRCCYFQFACECADVELRETVLDHLRRHDQPDDYEHHMQELQFNWGLLQQLKACPGVLNKYKPQLRRINLERLMMLDLVIQKQLLVDLYFANRNESLLQHLSKSAVWEYFVNTQNMTEIVRWCCCSANIGCSNQHKCADLEAKYCDWAIEPEMYEYALKVLQKSDEVLRNCFAQAGYFFPDERDDVPTILHRICTTESFTRNRERLEKLPIGRFLLQCGHYFLMLRDFVSSRELEELAGELPEHSSILDLIVTLKTNDMSECQGFETISHSVKMYLESCTIDFDSDQPLVSFYDFLCNEPIIGAPNCFHFSSSLKRIPYLKSLCYRLESNNSNAINTLPTPYDLLRKLKHIDFRQISRDRDAEEIASFSNKRLCEKYARTYQLNFLHYLKQQRSAYAIYYLLADHLQHYAQLTCTQLFSACETVIELALQHAANEELVIHCVAFCEMLNFDTQYLRNFIGLSRLLQSPTSPFSGGVTNYDIFLTHVERILNERVSKEPHVFPLAEYQALMRIVNACNQHRQWPQLILQRYARNNDWWCVLVLLQYFDVPLSHLKQVVEHFVLHRLGQHLLRALSYEPPAAERQTAKRRSSFSRLQNQLRKTTDNATITGSTETMTSSVSSCNDAIALSKQSHSKQLLRFLPDTSGRIDLFAIILLSSSDRHEVPEERIANASKFLEVMQDTQTHSTACNLMKNCVKFRLPILALLAATLSDMNVDWNWLIWLAVAIDQWNNVLRNAMRGEYELSWQLIEHAVRQGYIDTLRRSFCIFFECDPMLHLFNFLQRTQSCGDFSDDVMHELRLYLLACSLDEVKLPLSKALKREVLMERCIKLLLVHLQHNFNSSVEQQKFLDCICRSDIGDISGGLLDFCLLHEVYAIVENTGIQRFPLDFEQLLQRDNQVYEKLLSTLREAKEYDAALRLATLLNLPISDIVYAKWIAGLEYCECNILQQVSFEDYEREIKVHSLPPELLVNFFLFAATRASIDYAYKYRLLKRTVNVIKQHHLFPNESFDRDQIEYEMIVAYLQIEDAALLAQLDIYHSEYYEQIMVQERCVLYKSFLELKELAGVEDLSISQKTHLSESMQTRLEALLHRLLDEGDIVEALRLQELFECRPIDLRFVVFCMALAEGVTTIFSMSSEERQMLCEIEKSAFSKFNRRTLDTLRASCSGYASPLKSCSGGELSDSCSTLEFEEIPSKEKRETLETLQGIASKLRYGIEIGKRIVMAYRAAMYLDKEYLDVLRTKDTNVLLKSAAEEGCMHRLLVISDILTSTQMTPQEIAELLAFEITTAVLRPRFYIFNPDQQTKNSFTNAELWGYNIDRDLHLVLELTPNSTKLGNCLLEYCDALRAYRKYQDNKPYEHNDTFENLAEIIRKYGQPMIATQTPPPGTTFNALATGTADSTDMPPQVLSHKKQNLTHVELLIKAHQCFVHECSMEGIASVLKNAKALNNVLTQAKSWSLIVRLLVGIARYREMFYCFDALIENDQFESLLGQFDEERTVGLRQAILAYLREYCPANGREFLKLAALHFLMYKELAEMWEQDARAVLATIAEQQLPNTELCEQNSMASLTAGGATTAKTIIPKLRCTSEVLTLLQEVLEYYTHATENYLLDNKLLLAQKSVAQAELLAMQIDLAHKAMERTQCCVFALNVRTREEFRELINAELRVPQALILGRAYGYDINWTEAILSQYIILLRKSYLQEYLLHLPISDSIIDNIIKGYQLYTQHQKTINTQMEEHLALLVVHIKSVTLKYKLTSMLSLKAAVMSLINDQTIYYLRDTNYGRNDCHNMPDM